MNSEVYLYSSGKNTFLHKNGGSVIDLSISFGSISSILSTPYNEHCYTLFTGAPQKDHIPVMQHLVLKTKKSKEKHIAYNYDEADWEKWSSELHETFKESNLQSTDAKSMLSFSCMKLKSQKSIISL